MRRERRYPAPLTIAMYGGSRGHGVGKAIAVESVGHGTGQSRAIKGEQSGNDSRVEMHSASEMFKRKRKSEMGHTKL